MCDVDNPYDIADKWLEDEGLSPGYRQQVVEFILQNTGGAAASTGFDPNYVDPYTGGKSRLRIILLISWHLFLEQPIVVGSVML